MRQASESRAHCKQNLKGVRDCEVWCRELNTVDTALWERGRALLAAKLAEQRKAGILEEMPSSDDDALQRRLARTEVE
jgi:hypothetical protein